MKILLTIVVLSICGLLLMGIKINSNPFKIQFKTPLYGIGFILILVGVFMIRFESHSTGRKEAINQVVKILKSK